MADNICAPPGTEGDMEINEILDKVNINKIRIYIDCF